MLLRRYETGNFEAVWHEIRSHSPVEGSLRAEVLEVAIAAMRRVARNADLLADRLRVRGWKPHLAELTGLRSKPSAQDEAVFSRIMEISGAPIPPTLLAFWNVVGGINFVWDYTSGDPPDLGVALPMDEMDPLCVDPPSTITDQFDNWEDQKRSCPEESLYIYLAPDYLAKANVSGGPPYGIEVPFMGADPVFFSKNHALPFVDYLRLAFKWAGFPGLEDYGTRVDVRRFVQDFGRGLEPF